MTQGLDSFFVTNIRRISSNLSMKFSTFMARLEYNRLIIQGLQNQNTIKKNMIFQTTATEKDIYSCNPKIWKAGSNKWRYLKYH